MSWRHIDKQLQVRLIEKLVHILEVRENDIGVSRKEDCGTKEKSYV